MNKKQYRNWLRQLRAAERRKNRDYTETALEVRRMRHDTITDRAENPQAAEVEIEVADRHWEVWMQRDLPAEA